MTGALTEEKTSDGVRALADAGAADARAADENENTGVEDALLAVFDVDPKANTGALLVVPVVFSSELLPLANFGKSDVWLEPNEKPAATGSLDGLLDGLEAASVSSVNLLSAAPKENMEDVEAGGAQLKAPKMGFVVESTTFGSTLPFDPPNEKSVLPSDEASKTKPPVDAGGTAALEPELDANPPKTAAVARGALS